MAAELRKTKDDGTLYTRPPDVEAYINPLLALPRDELVTVPTPPRKVNLVLIGCSSVSPFRPLVQVSLVSVESSTVYWRKLPGKDQLVNSSKEFYDLWLIANILDRIAHRRQKCNFLTALLYCSDRTTRKFHRSVAKKAR